MGFGPKVLYWLRLIVRRLWTFSRVLDMEIVQAHGGDFLNPNQLLSYSIFGVAVQETSQSDLSREENCVDKGIQWKSPI